MMKSFVGYCSNGWGWMFTFCPKRKKGCSEYLHYPSIYKSKKKGIQKVRITIEEIGVRDDP